MHKYRGWPRLERKYRRFLIVRTDRIGDVILTLPMASVIKKRVPDAHITMLIRQYTTELADASPNVDDIITYDDESNVVPFFELIETIRHGNYDVVFHTHPIFRLALITWLAGIPTRVGTGFRWYSFLFTKKVYEHRKFARFHELEYNIHLISALGYSLEGIDISPSIGIAPDIESRIKRHIERLGLLNGKKFIILHPGSGNSARDWSPIKFGLLAQKLSEIENFQVVITGGKTERKLVDLVQAYSGFRALALADHLTICEFATFISKASLFVSNSTGPIHIAAAVGTPLIGFYPQITALSARRWGPWTDNKVIFSPENKPTDCTKCIKGKSVVCECMDTISVEDVYNAACLLIKKN